jgi:hypothetical protein
MRYWLENFALVIISGKQEKKSELIPKTLATILGCIGVCKT